MPRRMPIGVCERAWEGSREWIRVSTPGVQACLGVQARLRAHRLGALAAYHVTDAPAPVMAP